MPDIDGLADVPIITARNWINLDVPPGRLLMIGGSYLTLAFCQAFARLGTEVVHAFIALMNPGAMARTMVNSVVIHPTIGEAAKNAAVAAYDGG